MIIRTLFLILALLPIQVNANEKLRFQPPVSYKENKVLKFAASARNFNREEVVIASTDLNNDAINEYIITPQNSDFCKQNKLCPYIIVAFQNHKPIEIGQFDAHKILISNKKSYGIRQIIVYNNAYNDFKYITAIWNPFSFRFEGP